MEKITVIKRALLFFAVGMIASANAWAYDFEVDGIYYSKSGTEASVTYKNTNYNSYSGDVTIPETVKYNGTEYTVTSIGSHAFYKCKSLTSVIIGDNVTSIGISAFYNCSSLTSVDIPDNVETIGNYAFELCSSLESVTIGSGVKTIGNSAFMRSGLTSIVIPDNVETIETNAFQYCSSLESVSIGNGVETIGNYAFEFCSSLESVTIGENVETIGQYAFEGSTSLTEIYCLGSEPPTLTGSATSVFSGIGDLKSITVYVPADSRDAYVADSEWSQLTIYAIEDDPDVYDPETSGMEEIGSSNDTATEVARYDISGRLLASPQQGVNIVLYSDGTSEKIIVK